jgi:RNA recognition motif-containing protein
METKLYVGNLAYTTTDSGLQTLFSQAGVVKSVQVIKERDTGRSKGFGFVEMSTEEEAQKAITLLNGKEFDGRKLNVNLARPKEERGGSRGGSRSRYSDNRSNRQGGDKDKDW